MKFLVTGGAGFIGRRLVEKLLADGHEIVVVDKLIYNNNEFLRSSGVKFINSDLIYFDVVKPALKSVDGVFHLAAGSSFLMYREAEVDTTISTIWGFHNVLRAMGEEGVNNLVWTSTSAVYEGLELPYGDVVRIEDLSPPDLKARSKKWCEEIAYLKREKIRSIALRPFSVYGPGEEIKKKYASIISLFIWSALNGKGIPIWGDGNQTRDFIYVDDVVEFCKLSMEALMKDKVGFDVLNVGYGRETSFNEVIKIIEDYLGEKLPAYYVKVPIEIYAKRLLADMSKARKILGFEPKVTVEEGVKRVLEHAKNIEIPEIDLTRVQDSDYLSVKDRLKIGGDW